VIVFHDSIGRGLAIGIVASLPPIWFLGEFHYLETHGRFRADKARGRLEKERGGAPTDSPEQPEGQGKQDKLDFETYKHYQLLTAAVWLGAIEIVKALYEKP
jgi:hypothetical protein